MKLTERQQKEKENENIRAAFLSKHRSKIEPIFKKYVADDGRIDMEGVGAFLEDVDLDPMVRCPTVPTVPFSNLFFDFSIIWIRTQRLLTLR